MKKYFLILILSFLMACELTGDDKEKTLDKTLSASSSMETDRSKSDFELVQIEYSPTFGETSKMVYNVQADKILFSRIGSRIGLAVAQNDKGYATIYAPKTSLYVLTTEESDFLRRSVLGELDENDFKDQKKLVDDGIWNSIIITRSNGSFHDIEINNGATVNQQKLFTNLLKIGLKHEKDPDNIEYINGLLKYYE